MPDPSVSVVVTAFHRTEYLVAAVDSIVRGSVSSPPVEIVVVTNSIDPRRRHDLEGAGVRVLLSENPLLGPKVAEGVAESSGEVVAFLEDDDLFEPRKIDRLRSWFGSDRELGYVHHSMRPVGSDGDSLVGRFFRQAALDRADRLGEVRVAGTWSLAQLRSLRGLYPGFNNSCIALRRDCLVPALPWLRRVHLNVDEFLFLVGLASRRALRLSPERLTRFRVHGESASNPSGGDVEQLLDRMRSFSVANAESRRILVEFARQTRDRELQHLAEAGFSVQEAIAYLRAPAAARAPMARELLGMLRGADTFEVQTFPLVPILAAAFVLWPALGRRAYASAKATLR